MHYLYHQLKPLHDFFQAVKRIRYLIKELTALDGLLDEIDCIVVDADDPDLSQLRTLVGGAGCANSLTSQLLGGDIVMASDLLEHCRIKMFKGVALIGAIDAYISLAEWYETFHNHVDTPVCLAQFIEAPQPHLSVSEVWHPHICSRDVIANSITLGGQSEKKNAIVTGLCESGKSMLLNSFGLAVLCAQTIGICPARSYRATPFAMINIYSNIKDDLAHDRSLFKTELHRALTLVDAIKNLPPDSYSFSITDTTFSGTEAGAGQAAAYAVARYLGKLPSSIMVSATNFASLSLLEEHEPTCFTNYHLPSITTEDGHTKHLYTLQKGTQSPHLASAIFTEESLPEEMIAVMEKALLSDMLLTYHIGVNNDWLFFTYPYAEYTNSSSGNISQQL